MLRTISATPCFSGTSQAKLVLCRKLTFAGLELASHRSGYLQPVSTVPSYPLDLPLSPNLKSVQQGTVGPVERKLLELGEVRGIVSGNFGEVSEDTHALVAALATCRVRVAGVSRGRKGMMRTEEGERSLAISGLRRRLGVLTVKCQAHSLLGRLEVLGPGAAAAAGRRWQAAELERCWRKEERAHTLVTAQGWRSYRTGFGKLD